MKQSKNKDIINKLKILKPIISFLAKDDAKTKTKVIHALESTIPMLEENQNLSKELLKLCIKGIDSLYETSSDHSTLKSTISDAIICLVHTLSAGPEQDHQNELLDATKRLKNIVLCEQDNYMKDQDDKLQQDLNHLLARFVQVDPSEHHDLLQLTNELKKIAGQDTNEQVSGFLNAALNFLDQILNGTVADVQENIDNVSYFIEKAIHNLEVNKEEEFEDDDELSEVSESFDEGQLNAVFEDDDADQFSQLPADADESLLKEFIIECFDFLENAEAALLALETNTKDLESINTVFRAFHTIKGTAGFIGLSLTSEFAHHAESFLSRIRDGEISCTGRAADYALRAVDVMKELTEGVQNALDGEKIRKPAEYDILIEILAKEDLKEQCLESEGPGVDSLKPILNEIVQVKENQTENQKQKFSDDTSPLKPVTPPLQDVIALQQKTKKTNKSTETYIRVRTDKLDSLIDMVGELVIAHSMIAQDDIVTQNTNFELLKKVNHAGKIIRDFQDLSLSMRMIPLKGTFQTMARLARDLSKRNKKQIDFILVGEETEIDKNMVELVKDPLIHMVRNAIDHGIESPEERLLMGKTETGSLKLSAFHSGGNVIIKIEDDGRGLDRQKIVAKALSKGLIRDADNIDEQQALNLIFTPGFSTADKITEISGRGVGMDVVKQNIESINGTIDIRSKKGYGCTFSIIIPLTLAIADGMLVKVGEERYIIPTSNMHMTLRPTKELLASVAGKGEMIVLRDELLPMFRLHSLFDIEHAITDPTSGLIVIVGDGERKCAILVDELLGQYQVVVKSLGVEFGKIKGIAGAAILGDGRVGLIIDTSELSQLARETPNNDISKSNYNSAA